MRVSILASGSKGNSTFIEENNTRILVDLGMSCDYIESKLEELGVEPSSITAILITHTHSDHINGLTKFYKKYKPKIYITPKMIKVLNNYTGSIDYQYFNMDNTVIDDLSLNIIKTSHDAEDSVVLFLMIN
jgi:phosphoribosyl 1,2-cyclic phosphodiesterase